MFQYVVECFKRFLGYENGKKKIKGVVVLMNNRSSIFDGIDELLGRRISLQLISAVNGDSGKDSQVKIGSPANLGIWKKRRNATAGEDVFDVTFDWDEGIETPMAFVIRNNHTAEFYLKSLTLEHIPNQGSIYFICNSWVYPVDCYKTDRVFFSNKAYLPNETPKPLLRYREQELENLRGTGEGRLNEWDRVYDYAYYNDLGIPDKGLEYTRPVLGGSVEYPYPRRGRTGRPPTKTDSNTETRVPILSINGYIPRDEKFSHVKMSDAIAYGLKAVAQIVRAQSKGLFDSTPNEFDSYEDVLKLYEGKFELPRSLLNGTRKYLPSEFLKELFRTDGEKFLKFPVPQAIKEDKWAWRTDEEFAREMLAGLNPVAIRRLQEFPPKSKLDPQKYGHQNSSITEEHIIDNLDGMTVDEAIYKNKLYILDYHDAIMPHLSRFNSTSTKTYATRTLLFLKSDGSLKPLAIELSLPHHEKEQLGAVSRVYTPAKEGVKGSIWQLAKAYAVVNDSGYHQLISHWLHTHAAIEPFIIATNRQLSVLHPIHKLLQPHFRDTMHINSIARQTLLNASGGLERTMFPSKYSVEFSSAIYKDWVFPEQALPQDLIKRGMAVRDSRSPHGVRLILEDYPYAVDGLEIWTAIETWVREYCSFYYKSSDDIVRGDSELQSWWKELKEVGHGDKKHEPWWPKMQTLDELIESCTIIIWLASAYHAAINFGQYPCGGYLPGRPTISRKFMPEEGTPEYRDLEINPEQVFFKTITSQLQTVIGISLIEILSRHTSDEVYLGQRDTPQWTADTEPLQAFDRFKKNLEEIEGRITQRNNDRNLKNRFGPVKMPYTLLYPSSEPGLTGKGIPNSVSI